MAVRILGIDPGSRFTGFGVIDTEGTKLSYVDAGRIVTGDGTLADRLEVIFRGLTQIVETHRPTVAAIEGVFYHRNADSALKLGHARGVALVACRMQGLEVFEYAPTVIKKAVVGKGRADKQQVREMITMILKVNADVLQLDASDALGVAVCHAHHNTLGAPVKRKGRKGASGWEQVARRLEAEAAERKG